MKYCKECVHCKYSGGYFCDMDKVDMDDEDVEKYDTTCSCYSEK